jgi:DNA invertase Pin-like site-specific DNA recombinase
MGRKAKAIVGNPGLAVGYVRVSTDEQELSPKAQRAALDRWAASRGVELVAVLEDVGVSGAATLEQRPAMLAAVEALGTHGAGLLVVAKRDRLARDLVVAAMIERLVERNGARVVSADGVGEGAGPEAFMMRAIMDVFAQYERLVIKARTRAALAVKKAKGERLGHLPYGFRAGTDGVSLERDEGEQGVLSRIRELRALGGTYQSIVNALNAEQVPARGRRWHVSTVCELARREAA